MLQHIWRSVVNEIQPRNMMVQTVQVSRYVQLWAYISSSYGFHFVRFLDPSGNYFNVPHWLQIFSSITH